MSASPLPVGPGITVPAATGPLELTAFTLVPLFALVAGMAYTLLRSRRLGDPRPLVLVLLLGLMGSHQLLEVVRFQAGTLDLALSGELAETGANLLASLSSYYLLAFVSDERRVSRTLAEKRAELNQLNHVNELLRDVNRELVRASTRDDIEHAVCEQFRASGYPAAIVFENTVTTDALRARTVTGTDLSDELTGQLALGEGLIGRSLADGNVEIVRDAQTVDAPLGDLAAHVGSDCALLIPLVYEDARYGILAVMAGEDAPIEGFSPAVLDELGGTVGYAINAVESKRTLLTDNVVELEFRHAEPSTFCAALTGQLDCSLALDWLTVGPAGELELYLSIEAADPDDVLAFASRRESVTQAHQLDQGGGSQLFKFRVTADSIVGTLSEYGATVTELRGAQGTVTVTCLVSDTRNARSVFEAVEAAFPTATIEGSRERERQLTTDAEVQSAVEEHLTDKQQEALYTSYAAGYFEWPRDHSSEEIAGMLDIAQSTFLQHLRAAELNLLESLFEEPDTAQVEGRPRP